MRYILYNIDHEETLQQTFAAFDCQTAKPTAAAAAAAALAALQKDEAAVAAVADIILRKKALFALLPSCMPVAAHLRVPP